MAYLAKRYRRIGFLIATGLGLAACEPSTGPYYSDSLYWNDYYWRYGYTPPGNPGKPERPPPKPENPIEPPVGTNPPKPTPPIYKPPVTTLPVPAPSTRPARPSRPSGGRGGGGRLR